MQPSLGEYIRHLRRERSLTQTELGDARYSKSYVSALERGSIVPSRDALYFLAERLAQPIELFEHMLQQEQREHMQTRSPLMTELGSQDQQEMTALFNLILTGTNPSAISLAREIIVPESEHEDSLPPLRQARTAFLQGLLAQEKGDLGDAEHYFEYALALVSTHQRPAILDALGTNSYLSQAYTHALYYHQRALHALGQGVMQDHDADLLLLIELHCGHDYRVQGLHNHACEHYERARRRLRSTHHLLLAAQLYLGLGYCTYAAFYQCLPAEEENWLFSEEDEKTFQRSLSFLLQSRALYQASHDLVGVTRARLHQAMILLDLSEWRRQMALERARSSNTQPVFTWTALLDDVEEQCRQILMTWQESFSQVSTLTKEVENLLYSALAYLIRCYVQRAELARLGTYTNTATRDLSLAASLCQKVINTLNEPAFPWPLIQQILSLPGSMSVSPSPMLPPVPDIALTSEHLYDPLSLAEVCWAAGKLAEEMGRSAITEDFASSSYQQADQFWQMTLHLQFGISSDPERDKGYLIRCYQRYISYLQERVKMMPERMEEVYPLVLKLLSEMIMITYNSDDQ